MDALNSQDPSIVLMEECEEIGVLPFLDITIQHPTVIEDQEDTRFCQIDIYRESTHSNRYLNYFSAQPLSLKRNILKSLWLHAQRLLKCFPRNLKREVQFLRDVFCNSTNEYPVHLVDQWFNEFQRDLHLDPSILIVKPKLHWKEMFDGNGSQHFEFPSPEKRSPPRCGGPRS